MFAPARYDDLGTVNAVKLLPKIDSYNGYIKLYTELDSHIEEGDIIFITYSGDTSQLNIANDVILDNYAYVVYSDDFIYDPFAQGYKVIFVDKLNNSFAINRSIFSIPSGGRLYDHYVSMVVCNKILVNKANIDGTLFKSVIIDSLNQPNNVILKQAIVLEGDVVDCDIIDKYDVNYVSLLLTYNQDNNTFTKYSNLNNNDYGYSYFYNLNSSLKNCNISSGNYYNCSIKNLTGNSRYINGGYFYNCYVDEYNIYDGHFHNTQQLSNDCVWHYGKWDGNTFTLNVWEDGIFLNGSFGNPGNTSIWQNGTFLNGTWAGLIWVNGDFSGGLFTGTGYTDITSGQKIGTQWFDGKFRGGVMRKGTFNTIFWKNGDVYGGEMNNVILNNGNIYDGIFYDICAKNTNIYGGTFKTLKIQAPSSPRPTFNSFANSKIYNGVFEATWSKPTYSISDIIYSNGYNEFSDSKIYNGVFKYPMFYNFNTINNGDFENGLFISPITVNNGKFYGGQNNRVIKNYPSDLIIGNIRSNLFSSEKVSLSKGSIRSKILLNDSGTTVTKMYIEFDNGHNFNEYDADKLVELVGFNSQELYGVRTNIIQKNKYFDLSKPTTVSGNTFQYAEPVGDNYIIIEKEYKSWMFGDTGLIKKMNWSVLFPQTTSASTDFYEINNGTFSNSVMYGNINVYNGVFNNTTMRNGIQWYNGVFDGGIFQSLSGQSDNIWYNGQFYNGVFGLNILGQKETARISVSNSFCEIDNSDAGVVTSNTYSLQEIYPLVYMIDTNIGTNIGINNITAFSTSDNTLSPLLSRLVNDNRTKKYMNDPVWSRETTYLSTDISSSTHSYHFSPYEFVFRIDCDSYESRMSLKKSLDYINTDPSYKVSIISPADPVILTSITWISDTAVTNTSKSYLTFDEMFGMDYNYVDYVLGSPMSGVYPIYLIFRFNTIKDLYDNCTISEKEAFAKNFRNVWSIANTGYYTHPMPVLNGSGTGDYGNDDTDKVGKMAIGYTYSGGTYVYQGCKWIYGTCPPPWWIKMSGTTNQYPYIDWNELLNDEGVTFNPLGNFNVTEVGTISGSSTISNNGSLVNSYIINKSDIPIRIYDSIDRSINDEDSLSISNYTIPYPRKFTEWLFHYIKQHKNNTGYNFSASGVSFRDTYKYNTISDPKFNVVKNYKNNQVTQLFNLIYNSQVFNCKIVGNAVYFDNNFKLSDYFTVGDTVYIENVSTSEFSSPGIETPEFSVFALSPETPVADPNINDGTYNVITISGYNYSTHRSNIIYISGPGVGSSLNCRVNVYIQNKGLIVPYYYYVGENISFTSPINFQTFKYQYPLPNYLISNDDYNPTSAFTMIKYKNYGNKLAIKMQPIFHNYFPDSGFYFLQSGTKYAYFQHRNIYRCKLELIGSNYYITFGTGYTGDVRPWATDGWFFTDITGASSTTQLCQPSNILSNWKYDDNGENWISMSCYWDGTTNAVIKGTWLVSNSGLSGGALRVQITDPNWNPGSIPSSVWVDVGIEPTISCKGKIVNILYKDALGTLKTINTTILDYDFINKAYIFDSNAAGVYLNANDIYLGTNMKSINIFNSPGVLTSTTYTLVDPPSSQGTVYNTPYWKQTSPYNITRSTVTFPKTFERLSFNPYRDYFVNTIINYSGNTFGGTSPISAQRVVDVNNVIRNITDSIIYDSVINRFIYKDMYFLGGTIFQVSLPYGGTWNRNGRNYEIQKLDSDIWGNTHLLEKIRFFNTKSSSNEVLSTDKLQIEILSNFANNNSRIVLKEVNLKEKVSESEFKTLYPNYHLDSYSGLTRFGVYQMHSDHSQNRMYFWMKQQIANNLPNDLTWYYGDSDFSAYHNFHDASLFSVYHSYMKGILPNYSSFEIDDVFMKGLFYDMKNFTSDFSNIYNNILTETDKQNFKLWNSKVQTSTQNFNKKAGIQIFSRNVSANINDFKDHWYDGEFYGYRFEGAWHGGRWVAGDWFGWNSLNDDPETTGDTAFSKPTEVDISSKPKLNYELNYTELKRKKKYYDIAPWDQANKNNSENIGLPLRKKDR